MTLGLFRRLQGLQLCDLEAYISEYVPPGVCFRFMHAFFQLEAHDVHGQSAGVLPKA